MAEMLVVGAAGPEVCIDYETKRRHRRIGGVAAIVAQELHRGGNQPLLYTAVGDDGHAKLIAELLEAAGLSWHASPMAQTTCHAQTLVRHGDSYQPQGHYPAYATTDLEANRLWELTDKFDTVVIDSNLAPDVAQKIAQRARNFIVVVAHPSKVDNLLNIGTQHVKQLVCCNNFEAARIAGNRPLSLRSLQLALNTQGILVTQNSDDWRHRDQNHLVSSDAPPVPQGADFIGAGDAAAAGAIHALVNGTSRLRTINDYIERRLAHTAGLWYDSNCDAEVAATTP